MMRSRVTPPHISRDISQSTYLRIKRRPRYSYVDLFDTPVTRTIVILIILETVLFLTPKLKTVNLLFLHYSLPTYLFSFTFFCNFIDKSNIVVLLQCDKNIRLASWGASLPTKSKLNPLTLGSYCTPYVGYCLTKTEGKAAVIDVLATNSLGAESKTIFVGER